MSPTSSADAAVERIDPRGQRFIAGITSVLLLLIVFLGPGAGLPLLIVQTAAFGAASLFGLGYHPWGWIYRTAVRPRLAAPREHEDARPARFAQTVGLAFAGAALAGIVVDLPALFYGAVGLALVAALLNAVFGFCLGCELYLLGRRLLAGRPSAAARG